MTPERIPKRPPEIVTHWVLALNRALLVRRVQHPQISEDALVKIAARLALIGPTAEPKAIEAFHSLVPLLLSWRRVKNIFTIEEQLPVEPAGLLMVAASLRAAERVEKVEAANFPTNNFISVSLQLTDPGTYRDVCVKDKLDTIRAIWHPNTLKYVKERYRGVVGDLASPEYRDLVRKKIRTVT